jgi:hypothetical protein
MPYSPPRNEGLTPTTAVATIVRATAPLACVVQGQIFECADPAGWAPVLGDAVLVDYLPVSGQWLIVAII